MKKVLLSFGIILFFMVSCKDYQKKETESSKSYTTISTDEAQYRVDSSKSKISWTGYKIEKSLNLSHFGSINIEEGTLTFKNNQLQSGSLIADMASLQVEDEENKELNDKLTQHLKSKDFLDVAAYPQAVFTIKSVKSIEGYSDYNTEITGNLQFKDISKDIFLKANTRSEKNTFFLNTEKFSIKRSDFGITYKGLGNSLINDDLDLQVSIEANIN